MIYSTRQSRIESLLRKIRNSVMEIEEAMKKLEKLSEEQHEIVHCKDCVSYHDTIDKETGCLLGIYVCDLFEDEPPTDWYCADGIRRTDD